MGVTLNFIDIWLKLFEDNYDSICVAYKTSMKEMFKQIPLTMIKALTTKKSTETYEGNLWWMVYGKSSKGLPPLRRSILGKNHKIRRTELKDLLV